ncbi:hypothetical protein LPMP_130910 [Leishmania panamensis]|uniref:Mannosyltransferase, putative n=1 Tax=Leishmania panamensis TaxID=5679 RepID=A0A088RL12_LEIPA|nr:hypothetical protein LPMP_130910 [Leishmania panamensis]AIN96520.1 hypothetical protein LPMP_130910 [Leishmania panamensis]
MHYGNTLRYAALLVLFGLLLLISVLHGNLFDDVENSHAGEMQELRGEAHSMGTLLFTPRVHRRVVPLALDRREFPHVTDTFVAEYINRTVPPQLSDVRDVRTLVSKDFFEQIQFWRRPGSAAAQVSKLVDALAKNERVEARAEALSNRQRKSWKTRHPATSLFSFLAGSHREEDDEVPNDDVVAEDVVKVPYPSSLVLHYHGSSDSSSLAFNDVQLVPYPLVPPPPPHADMIVKPECTGENAENRTAAAEAVAIDCGTDPAVVVTIPKGKRRYAMPHRKTPHRPTHGWDHFYIALNLWKNEEVLPDLTEALIVFLEEEVKPFFDLATSVVVAIYSNISPDRTSELIATLLIPRLHAAGVRNVYATTEGTCLGYVERQPFHERIEWMACIRNKALEPLYEKGMNVFGGSQQQQQEQQADVNGDADGLVVLFFNDILFRPQDITALLESRAEARMAATTRPHGWLSSVMKTKHESAEVADAGIGGKGNLEKRHVSTTSPLPSGATSTTPPTTFDMACGMDFYFTFYDTWITRDRLGKPFKPQMPYSDDRATQEAFYRIFNHEPSGGYAPETSAIPVKCCWNGLAAIRGRFFLPPTPQHRLEFPAQDVAETTVRPSPVTSSMPATAGDAHNATAAAVAPPPDVLLRPSGAIYDRVGDVHDLLNTTTLARYYTRLLTRRLQSECASWSSTRREIAEVTDVPFYEPETCDNSSSFESLLQSVVNHEAWWSSASNADWTRLGLRIENRTVLIANAPGPAHCVDAAVKAEGMGDGESAAPAGLRVEEDSVYYRARHPSVRFRHSFTPSYGATVTGRAPVRDEVCLASECLLICQDVMHAALLQDRRAPIILLNPHVRVAYKLEHFKRVIHHAWFFEHPYVYWAWTLARNIQLWLSFSSSSTQDKSASTDSLRELGSATSAMDDWLHPASVAAASKTVMRTVHEFNLQDGDGRVTATGLIDIPTLTRMDCEFPKPGSIKLAIGALYPFLRQGQLLLAALLLRWLCRQVKENVLVAAPSAGGGAARAYSVEEQWRSVLYYAVWYSPLAQGLRRWASGGALSRIIHPLTSSLPTLLQQLHHLQSHRFAKISYARSRVGAVWHAVCFAVQKLMQLLGRLVCVRWWDGCLSRRRSFANLSAWQSSKVRQLLLRRRRASPAKSNYLSAAVPALVSIDVLGADLAITGGG